MCVAHPRHSRISGNPWLTGESDVSRLFSAWPHLGVVIEKGRHQSCHREGGGYRSGRGVRCPIPVIPCSPPSFPRRRESMRLISE